MARYPYSRGEVKLPHEAPTRITEAAGQRRMQQEVGERVRSAEQDGWGDIWYAFGKARHDVAVNREVEPNRPLFLVEDSHLAPGNYQLNQCEAKAALISRRVTSISEAQSLLSHGIDS